MSIYKHEDLNLKNLNYKKPEKQGLVYYSAIDYKNTPFFLQTPRMIFKKSGLETMENKNKSLEIETINNNFSFYDTFVSIDELNVENTFKNNKEWFGKDIPLEVIDNMYKRTNKPVKKDSKPIFSFKVPFVKENIQCQIYDQKQTCVDMKTIKENTECVCILHIKGLKFLKQHYYLDVYISQIKVFLEGDLKYNILDKYSFDDKDEIDNDIKELEKDLMLDEEYINSLKDKENEKNEILLKIQGSRDEIIKHETIISELKLKLDEFN